MSDTAFNPALIRVVIIVGFLVLSQFLRMRKSATTAKPAPPNPAGKQSPLELIREAMLQAKQQQQAQARQRNQPRPTGEAVEEFPMQVDQPQVLQDFRIGEQLDQPPAIQPESSLIPSALLLALLACLFLMAYRYWAG